MRSFCWRAGDNETAAACLAAFKGASAFGAPNMTFELTSDGEKPAKLNVASWDWSKTGRDHVVALTPGWVAGAVVAPMSMLSYAGVVW